MTYTDEQLVTLAKILRDYVSENYLEIAQDILENKPCYIYTLGSLPTVLVLDAASNFHEREIRSNRIFKLIQTNHDKIKTLRNEGQTYKAIAKAIGCSASAIGNYIKFRCDVEKVRVRRSPASYARIKDDEFHLVMQAYFAYVDQFPLMTLAGIASKIWHTHNYGYTTSGGMRNKYAINTLIVKISGELRRCK